LVNFHKDPITEVANRQKNRKSDRQTDRQTNAGYNIIPSRRR